MKPLVFLLTWMVQAAFGDNTHHTTVHVVHNFGCKKQGFHRRLQEDEGDEKEEKEDGEEKEDDGEEPEGDALEASASGDPHYNNFETNRFDHMGLGEYEIARTKTGHMKYFVWQGPVFWKTSAACIMGSSIRIGRHKIEYTRHGVKVDGAAAKFKKGLQKLKDGTHVFSKKDKICVDAGDGKSSILVAKSVDKDARCIDTRIHIAPDSAPPKGSTCADWSPDQKGGKRSGSAKPEAKWDFCGKKEEKKEETSLRGDKKKPKNHFSGDTTKHLHKDSGMKDGKWPKNYDPPANSAEACKKAGMKFSKAKKECGAVSEMISQVVGDAMSSDMLKGAMEDCIFDYCVTGKKDFIASSMTFMATTLGGKDIDIDQGKMEELMNMLNKDVDEKQMTKAMEDFPNLIM